MARRHLTPDEEARMAAEAEGQRDSADAWRLDRPRQVNRGMGTSAVLSVRVPAFQLHALRKIAARKKLTLSDALKDAIAGYLARPGSPISSNFDRANLYLMEPPVPETSQPGVAEVRDRAAEFIRPDFGDTLTA